jgi:tRNA threonylcarbamoyl adenosine modification protein YeaZ
LKAVLAIDTAGDHCAVGLFGGENRLAGRSEPMRRGHAERLMPLVAETLAEAGIAARALSTIIVCTGPGGFAGARIGVSAARGLALATGVRAVGVSWLEALGLGATGRVLVRAPHAGGFAIQRFADGAATTPPRLVAADDPDAAPADGERLAAPDRFEAGGLGLLVSAARRLGLDQPRPAPLYLRPPDAAPPSTPPPELIP